MFGVNLLFYLYLQLSTSLFYVFRSTKLVVKSFSYDRKLNSDRKRLPAITSISDWLPTSCYCPIESLLMFTDNISGKVLSSQFIPYAVTACKLVKVKLLFGDINHETYCCCSLSYYLWPSPISPLTRYLVGLRPFTNYPIPYFWN